MPRYALQQHMPRNSASKRIQPLYPKLPAGRSKQTSEQIAANQIERLQKAMIYAISNRGYNNTTVADVTTLAGVARRTFYEHFANKQECFLATYDAILQRIMIVVAEAYGVPDDWESKIQAAFLAFVKEITSNPDAAQLILIHSASAGEVSIKRHNDAIGAFEALIADSFTKDPAYRDISAVTLKAILGGVRQVIYGRLRQGRAIELPELVPDLLAWARTYRDPPVKAQGIAPTGRRSGRRTARRTQTAPSRGGQRLPRSAVIHSQRERLIQAVALISASEGYAALTVPHIASAAGVSHKTFYEHFADKDQAFSAACEVAAQRALDAAASAYAAEPDWPRAIHAAIRTLALYLSGDPSFARMTLVEVLAAGPAALAQRDQMLRSFSLLLAPGQRQHLSGSELPQIVPEAISGGIMEVLYFEISNDRAADLPRLVGQLTYIALAPFIGTEQAARVADEPVADGPDAAPARKAGRRKARA